MRKRIIITIRIIEAETIIKVSLQIIPNASRTIPNIVAIITAGIALLYLRLISSSGIPGCPVSHVDLSIGFRNFCYLFKCVDSNGAIENLK